MAINNIEVLRIAYSKASVTKKLRSKNDLKAMLHTWRDSMDRHERQALNELVNFLKLTQDGYGELSALEHIFRLVEFVHFCDQYGVNKSIKNRSVKNDSK